MSAAAQIDWQAIESGQTGAAPAPATQNGSGAIDWDAIENRPQPKPGIASRAAAGYKAGLGLPSVNDLGTVQSNVHAAEHPIESLAQAGRGLYDTYRSDVNAGYERMRAPGVWNKLTGGEEYLESAIPFFGHNLVDMQERSARGDTAGALGEAGGILTSALGPQAVHEAIPAARARAANLLEAAKGTPEDVSAKGTPGLKALQAQRRASVNEALRGQARKPAPLYENLSEADRAMSPGGGTDLSRVEGLPETPKPKEAKLTPKEMQDAGFAAKEATRYLADGASEADVRGILKNLGYSPNSVTKAMESVTQPGESGGYTLDQARVIRQNVARDARAADRAAARGEPGAGQRSASLWRTYNQVTDAMRERARELGGANGVAQFESADAQYREAMEMREALRPLREAKTPREFEAAWKDAATDHPDVLQRLAKEQGMNLGQLKRAAQTARTVLKGVEPSHTNFLDRYIKGTIPARLGVAGAIAGGSYLYGRNRNVPEWERSLLWTLPALGYVGAGIAQPILTRASALRAIADLPPTLAPAQAVEPTELIAPGRGGSGPEPIAPGPNGTPRVGEGTSAVHLVTEAAPRTNVSQQMMSEAFERQRLENVLRDPRATPEERAYARNVLAQILGE